MRITALPYRLIVSGDDSTLLDLPGPVRFAVQVKERTCGRERGAPTSIDCAAAGGARSRSTHEWGSLVLGPVVSMVPIGKRVKGANRTARPDHERGSSDPMCRPPLYAGHRCALCPKPAKCALTAATADNVGQLVHLI